MINLFIILICGFVLFKKWLKAHPIAEKEKQFLEERNLTSLVDCPICGLPSEIIGYGTDGIKEALLITCLGNHAQPILVEMLENNVSRKNLS